MCGKNLRLDKSEVNVGEEILIMWNLPEVLPDPQDWIGMYKKGRCINHVTISLLMNQMDEHRSVIYLNSVYTRITF